MKVLAVSGSARKGGNTATLLEAALTPLREAGFDCELVEIAGQRLEGCTVCLACRREQDRRCHGRDDIGNAIIEKMDEADAVILGSPVYFGDITPEMKALIDRAGYVSRGNGNMFARKPGATVVAVRRAGAMHALDSMNHFFLIGEMVLVGSSYWNVGVGGDKGSVAEDTEGMNTMRRLGENLAWVMQRFAEGQA